MQRAATIVLVFLVLCLLPATARAQATFTFTVNNLGDEDDLNPGDEICDVNSAVGGSQCSLRAAIEEANARAGPDVIEFSVSGTISIGTNPTAPNLPLPDITGLLAIDGTTAPGYAGSPVVELDGSPLSDADADGLTITSPGVEIIGLSIVYFPDRGIESDAEATTVMSCFIGVRTDGTTAAGNGQGVRLEGSAQVGGTDANEGNIIAGNEFGDLILRAGSTVEGNYIGTNPLGDDLGSGGTGIAIIGDEGSTIGGTADGAGNVIGFNAIAITVFGSNNNVIQGNYIGTDVAGTDLGNSSHGIRIENEASNNTIGGTAAGAGNVISGNDGDGVRIRDVGTTGNEVLGNRIGTNATGDAPLSNSGSGVLIRSGASGNTIGGPSSDARNVISGNGDRGVRIQGSSTGNTVQGNYIGTSADGDVPIGNSFGGVEIRNAPNNLIGGTVSGAGNVISGNGQGVVLAGGDATGNEVFGNLIGTEANGTDPMGNGTRGVLLTFTGSGGASNNTIGGTGTGEGNVIAYNGDVGVQVRGSSGSPFATGNSIRGNSIFGNSSLGIDLYGGEGVTTNDAGDNDDGVNRLQNFPEIQSADYDPSTGNITLSYFVSSNPTLTGSGASAYPLTVDFYKADADNQEGEAYLGTDTYTPSDYDDCGSPPCEKTVTFAPVVSVTRNDFVVATATDDDGNTSEFSATANQLPVELARFEATVAEEGVVLSWKTLSEKGNAAFEIQRRRARQRGSAGAWAEVSAVESQAPGGTSSDALVYRFTDTDLPFEAQRLTYRLVQHDRDGGREVLGKQTVEVGAPQQFALHGAFPNPVRGQATIRYELPEERRVTVALYDALGRRVRTLVDEAQSGRQEVTFAAAGLASGVYFVRMRAGDFVETQRMVLVR